jgi:hypothetical protein
MTPYTSTNGVPGAPVALTEATSGVEAALDAVALTMEHAHPPLAGIAVPLWALLTPSHRTSLYVSRSPSEPRDPPAALFTGTLLQ